MLGREPAVRYSQIEDHVTISSDDKGAAITPHLLQVRRDAVLLLNARLS